MKTGDVIGGYRVVTEPTNAGGGKCMWAFAERDGREYFLKRFLEPKRPREGSGSAASRRVRLEACRDFEDRHNSIMRLLRPDAPGAGNLVLATDFFHEGSTYYKVTERIDITSLDRPQSLDPRRKSVLLKTLGTSLRLLHTIDVVHGDLKPANVLVQKRKKAAFHTAKLIDFDDSYLAGNPPGREEVAGDSLYGAPEWRRYVQGDESVEGRDLTTAVDIFALGLMTHYYLTGSLPGYDARFGSPADAVIAGDPLVVDERLDPSVRNLVRAMTAPDPGARPTVATFLAALQDPQVCALVKPRPKREAEDAGGSGGRVGSRLRINLPSGPESARPADTEADVAAEASRRSRVRINLGGRPADRSDTPSTA
ncbi:hypothetical protein GCM10027168_15830 [Streptomyces capparidis]